MKIAIFYKNFREVHPSHSHIGLGVSAMHTAKVLKHHGIHVRVFGVRRPEEIASVLKSESESFDIAMIQALWVPTQQLEALMGLFPRMEVMVRCHSQVGFLSVDPGAVRLLREGLSLQDSSTNFHVTGNSKRFCHFVEQAYGSRCLYVPNLYDAERVSRRHRNVPHEGPLRIASFGALRLLKLHPTAAAAALLVARHRGHSLEFYINSNRERGEDGILQTIRSMFYGLPRARLIEVPWAPWAEFRQIIASMDVCIQVSATETFNLVTADAVAEGVPSAVSEVIEWVPDYWKTSIDDPQVIADSVSALLDNRRAADDGIRALTNYTEQGVVAWKELDTSRPQRS